jgi:dTDP-glucose 4,6-dehydratase
MEEMGGLKVLVTGGAGFIGSNFVRYFLRVHPDYKVVNLDKLTYAGNLDNLTDVQSHPNYQFVRGDICDLDCLRGVLRQGIDAVVHFAAESHVDRSIADAREFLPTNVQGTFTLLEAARYAKVSRFLHVSTDEVYGSQGRDEEADEESLLKPNSPYAASKAASDLVVRACWKTYGFPAVITRSSNNYGPNQYPEKLIPLMITNAVEGKKLPVYGDGLNERDWIFVEDHCRALDEVLHRGKEGEIYNIGFGHPISNLTVVGKILRILGRLKAMIEFVPDRPGHDRRYALNTDRISRDLKLNPAIGLDEGLERTVEWYRTNSEWVEKAKSGEYRAYYERYYERRNSTLAEL